MKIMCDTNIIIDVLLEREPFVEDSYRVLSLCEEHKIDGFVSASSVTDIYYLVRKYTHSTELAYQAVGKLVTRNKKDFEEFGIPALMPAQLLLQMA